MPKRRSLMKNVPKRSSSGQNNTSNTDSEEKKSTKRRAGNTDNVKNNKKLKTSANQARPDCTLDSNSNAAISSSSTPYSAIDTTKPVRLDRSFYEQDCEVLAKKLLGKTLVSVSSETGERLSGKIVETEAYLGIEDKAAHSYNGKRTPKTEAMFMQPGTAYVYYIYGSYCCMNISSRGEGAAVLLRALEPVEGKSTMTKHRTKGNDPPGKKWKEKDLCNGPSKLCQALAISKVPINKQDMTSSDLVWLEDSVDVSDEDIIIGKRININYAQEWVEKPLRFYLYKSPCISVRDKTEEASRK